MPVRVAENGNPRRLCNQDCQRKVRSMEAPHQLSRQAFEEFKTIYQEEFGEHLSDDAAQEIALRLLRLFDLLLQPLPGDPPGQSSPRNAH